MEDKYHNLLTYLASVAVLRRLKTSSKCSEELIVKLNIKNAEKMGCEPMAI